MLSRGHDDTAFRRDMKNPRNRCGSAGFVVELAGFEPATLCLQSPATFTNNTIFYKGFGVLTTLFVQPACNNSQKWGVALSCMVLHLAVF